jgi:protein-glutamine gamma-glutamyltransferase
VPEPAPAPLDAVGRIEQALVVAMAGAAIVGFTAVHGARLALLALVPVLSSLLWRPARVPRWIARPAPGILRIALASVFLMRAGLTIYPFLDDERVAAVALITGSVLVPLLAAAVLGTRVWRPAWAAVPLSIALLVVASFDPNPQVRWAQVTEAVLGLAYLTVVRPRLEPPTGGRRTWARAAALAGFAIVAGTLAVVIARFLPWAQPHVEDAAATLLSPSFPVAQAGFSANSKLGDIERLALSRTVVLRVWTPSPRKLRARVLTEFDGHTWHAPRPGWVDLPPARTQALPEDLAGWLAALPGTSFGDAAEASRPEQTRMRVAQAVIVADTLFSPVGVAIAHVRGGRLRSNRFGILEAPADPLGMYALVHAPVAASPAGGADAETLAVPADTDPRLRALADALSVGDPSPAARVARTANHLSRECRYSLDVGAFTSGQPVAEFLFEKKRGYCEYFASAAAVLLRLQGVPARYVTGFSMDASEALGGHYVVRESDAHAWIEAWIPGRGWVEVDPTPAADYAAVHARGASPLAWVQEWLKARWAEAALAVRTGELRRLGGVVAFAFAVVMLPVAAVLGMRRWRRRRAVVAEARAAGWNGDAELARVMQRLDSLWARYGQARPAHRAPLEHLQRVPPGRLPPALQAASADVIACYYDARYGGRFPARETVRGLARRLEDHPS